jgi:hypothetical protein
LVEFMQEHLLGRGFVLESDLALYCVAKSPEEAVAEIERFYRNYHSARFIGERLIMRLRRAPDEAALQRLNQDFADLLQRGSFEVIKPTAAELRDNDALKFQRLAFYPWHHYGRLRQLIDVLNEEPSFS